MTSTGRSLLTDGWSSNATDVHTTSPGSALPSGCGA
jgi:hypothetical protein